MPPRKKVTELDEFSQTRKELQKLEKAGKLFRAGRLDKSRVLLANVIGRHTYDATLERFGRAGQEIIDRAAKEIAKKKVEIDRRRVESVEVYRRSLRLSGLSEQEARRALPPVRKRRTLKTSQYYKAPNTPGIKFRNQWVRIDTAGIRHRTTKVKAAREISKEKYNQKVTRLANTLLIPRREAQGLYRDVRKRALADLAKFKKSKAYKNLSPKHKKRFTSKRWANASAAALFQLLEIGSP